MPYAVKEQDFDLETADIKLNELEAGDLEPKSGECSFR
jgi:hypothetical protein